MSFVLVGANHRSAALDVRERLHFGTEGLGGALGRLVEVPGIREGFLLSTCNRTEVLALPTAAESSVAVEGIKEFLSRERAFHREELERILYVKTGDEAVRHVFRLGIGLDSMVLGEPQILGQVKEAYQAAVESGTLGTLTQNLLQRSFAVAKKIRSETAIGRNPVSVSFAAVDLAQKIFGDLSQRSVLILGAGETAELTARHLVGNGIHSIFVANRTFARAETLARTFRGEAVPFDRILEYMERVDIVISSTSSTQPILEHADALRVIKRRRNRPLFLVDIAVPRDIDPTVNRIDNIFLYDIDDLQSVAEAGMAERKAEAEKAEDLVLREVEAYQRWLRSQEVAPTIVALRSRLHRLREEELRRHSHRLGQLPEEERRLVDEITIALINKLLHRPIRELKQAAASPNGADRIDVVRQVFGLAEELPDPEPTAQAPGRGGEKGR